MAETNDRRIFAGYYKHYGDGKVFYVVTESVDYETGEPTVIMQEYYLTGTKPFITISKKSFCESVTDKKGQKVKKFTRKQNIPIHPGYVSQLLDLGLRGPIQHKTNDENEYTVRKFRQCCTYYDYAKDIIQNYALDRKRMEICIARKRAIGVKNAAEFKKMKEDIHFLDHMLESLLSEYKDFFTERFIERKSIRKYGIEHNQNRGCVDNTQRKFYKAFAEQLASRDKYDGICRLITPADAEMEDIEEI